MQMHTDRETIPVGQGRSIVRESASLILDGYGLIKCLRPVLIYTNVFARNANGLCALCLEQRVTGEGWEMFVGYENGTDMYNNENSSVFLVCTTCKAISRIGALLRNQGNLLTNRTFMKYAREEKWMELSFVSYESD